METFELWSLIFSGFTAIGTCGATALALFFWLHDSKLKLHCHSMLGEGYGNTPQIEGGYFVCRFINMGYKPIRLEIAGLRFNDRRFFPTESTIIMFGYSNENFSNDLIPKLLQHGESYNYVVPWKKFVALCSSNDKKSITVFACTSSTRKEIQFKLSNDVIKNLQKITLDC